MFHRYIWFFVLVLIVWPCHVQAIELRVATYNALNFRGQADADRYAAFRTVLRAINPDVVAMQEIADESGADHMLSDVFLFLNSDWAAAPFTNYSSDTESALYYRTSKVLWVAQRAYQTEPRRIVEYTLQPVGADTTLRFRVLSAHLKASQGSSNEERRRQAAVVVRQNLDELPAGSLFMMCGDFNVYRASEPAYQTLTTPGNDPDGQLFDPINRPGSWSQSISFADIHTQSPRTISHGGGVTGGLDDRFDFILVSAGLMDSSGARVLVNSYTSYGNDGRHFNQAVNDGVNYSVPDSIADALEWASDHLPVFVDFEFVAETNAAVLPISPRRLEMIQCYPNPCNAVFRVDISSQVRSGNLTIADLQGRVLSQYFISESRHGNSIKVDFADRASGIYFVIMDAPSVREIKKVILSK